MKNIEEEIFKTLDSIDKIQPVSSNPYLYAKIKNRINQRPLPVIMPWMSYAKLAVCMFIVGFNIVTISKIYISNSQPTMTKEELGNYLGISGTQNVYEP